MHAWVGCGDVDWQDWSKTEEGESRFPYFGSPGDLEADDATGQSFSTKTQVIYVWWYDFPLYAYWDVRVEVIDG